MHDTYSMAGKELSCALKEKTHDIQCAELGIKLSKGIHNTGGNI
jgi:hypothetical protein